MNYCSLDIGGTNTRFSIIDGNGNLIFFEKNSTPSSEADLFRMVAKFLSAAENDFELSDKVGVSVAGLYDARRKNVLFPNAFEGRSIELKSIFPGIAEKNLFINDDRTAGIYGEKYFGWGKEKEEFAYLIIGTGVGLGIMKNRECLRGADYVAGSVGWIKYDEENTYEEVLSGPGISEYYRNLSGDYLSTKEIFEEYAKKTNYSAIETIDRMGEGLGKMLSHIFNFINPQRIILGGSVGKQWDKIRKTAEDIIFKNISPYIKTIDIKVSYLDDNATLLGNVGQIINSVEEYGRK